MPRTVIDEPDAGLAALLRGFRQRALLTQEELAAQTGLSARTIRRLESSQLLRPRAATIRVLAGHLGLSYTEQCALVVAAVTPSAVEPSEADQPPVPGGPNELPRDIADFTGRSELIAAVSAAVELVRAAAVNDRCALRHRHAGPPGQLADAQQRSVLDMHTGPPSGPSRWESQPG
ncbi:helix-turn-helix domain-containing protein [Planosporangium mesophilum]|uniref:HTH cro/C1-type domain-containing protein n=1 Tax=Planosporangium mesophilum TaxID=689768 RepID=A0A8J3TFN7_9ACTN|nr:helix-turn-helix transcriptional regulator [Planosporangium mesophilum]GII24691.1 hypothetical protein Pme01_42880 [Planosporangium mesophilum]